MYTHTYIVVERITYIEVYKYTELIPLYTDNTVSNASNTNTACIDSTVSGI